MGREQGKEGDVVSESVYEVVETFRDLPSVQPQARGLYSDRDKAASRVLQLVAEGVPAHAVLIVRRTVQ